MVKNVSGFQGATLIQSLFAYISFSKEKVFISPSRILFPKTLKNGNFFIRITRVQEIVTLFD